MQERQRTAIYAAAEIAAWKEYGERENEAYQRWLYRRMSDDRRIAVKKAEDIYAANWLGRQSIFAVSSGDSAFMRRRRR